MKKIKFTIRKHQPGQHDQMTHGRKLSTGAKVTGIHSENVSIQSQTVENIVGSAATLRDIKRFMKMTFRKQDGNISIQRTGRRGSPSRVSSFFTPKDGSLVFRLDLYKTNSGQLRSSAGFVSSKLTNEQRRQELLLRSMVRDSFEDFHLPGN